MGKALVRWIMAVEYMKPGNKTGPLDISQQALTAIFLSTNELFLADPGHRGKDLKRGFR